MRFNCRLSILTVLVGTAWLTPSLRAQQSSDSLYDMFPLAVGNEWIYDFSHHLSDDPYLNPSPEQRDTGTVILRIIDKSVTADSTVWLFSYTYVSWSQLGQYPYYGPHEQKDTTSIIEYHADRHLLVRTGDPQVMRYSALPLMPNLVDTGRVYRYAANDSSPTLFIASKDSPQAFYVNFSFTAGIGLTRVQSYRGCTCLPTIDVVSVLRASTITGVVDQATDPVPFSGLLTQNYPNPFNSATTFVYELARPGYVSWSFFDSQGRHIRTHLSGQRASGKHSLTLDFGSLPSGAYFYRLSTESYSQTRRMTILK